MMIEEMNKIPVTATGIVVNRPLVLWMVPVTMTGIYRSVRPVLNARTRTRRRSQPVDNSNNNYKYYVPFSIKKRAAFGRCFFFLQELASDKKRRVQTMKADQAAMLIQSGLHHYALGNYLLAVTSRSGFNVRAKQQQLLTHAPSPDNDMGNARLGSTRFFPKMRDFDA